MTARFRLHFLFSLFFFNFPIISLTCKLQRLTKFDWLTDDLIHKCTTRLERAVPNYAAATFESVVQEEFVFRLKSGEEKSVLLQGQLDIVAPDTVWEIKCVAGELSKSHILQLAIYTWLWIRNQPSCTRRFRLLNVLSGELWELTPNLDLLDRMMQLLLSQKFEPPNVFSDEQFVELSRAGLKEIGQPMALPSSELGFEASREAQMAKAGWSVDDCLNSSVGQLAQMMVVPCADESLSTAAQMEMAGWSVDDCINAAELEMTESGADDCPATPAAQMEMAGWGVDFLAGLDDSDVEW